MVRPFFETDGFMLNTNPNCVLTATKLGKCPLQRGSGHISINPNCLTELTMPFAYGPVRTRAVCSKLLKRPRTHECASDLAV